MATPEEPLPRDRVMEMPDLPLPPSEANPPDIVIPPAPDPGDGDAAT